ncbi:MAG: hypothetical protein QOE45_3047 [Frankiaceae bacterium]|nr:hypothetical protein [Frankiaceae bacterium]
MRRATATAVAVVLLAACGGGKPAAKPSAAPSAPALSASARAIRGAVARALAACPCSVEVNPSGVGSGDSYFAPRLTGVYDARTRSATLRVVGEPGVEVRVVAGHTYLTAPQLKGGYGSAWVELDFSGLPARNDTPLAALAVVDPAMAFAVASSVADASLMSGTNYETAFDVPAAVAGAGPSGALLRRLLPPATAYGRVGLTAAGALKYVDFTTIGQSAAQDDQLSAGLSFKAGHVKGGPTVAPPGARLIDVAKLSV